MKLLIVLSILWASFSMLSARADSFDVPAKHAIAVEVSTGKILYEKEATTPAAVASTSKLLTVYLVYQAIKEGTLSWDSKVDISDYAYQLTTNPDVSNVPMPARQYSVRELVEASLIPSANSAAIALAEKIAGSEPKFVDMMIKQLESWGITDAKLVNASGLNNDMLGEHIYPNSQTNDENRMSAMDLAIVARHLITDFPEVLEITQKASSSFGETSMTNSNLMLETMPYARLGVDGLKTGTTQLAGACFVATTLEEDMRVITVILDADNADSNDGARFSATNALLDYVYHTFSMKTLVTKGQSYQDSRLEVLDGKSSSVTLVADADFKVVVPKNNDKVTTTITQDQEAYAPIKKGQALAKLVYKDTDLVGSGYLEKEPSITLLAKDSVEPAFFLTIWWHKLIQAFT
ncbi:D-alanyl-D-alanine carboxypeptidase PBP3 [Streptococcus sp. zg-JUN1979]|uniref:D-alanyl-D-alanine carboxypeptidase PBP3 n=1 Tax=Streptococcus sp. zg-JUN1979 TaxID=3391450 RepID=UPI0039A4506E